VSGCSCAVAQEWRGSQRRIHDSFPMKGLSLYKMMKASLHERKIGTCLGAVAHKWRGSRRRIHDSFPMKGLSQYKMRDASLHERKIGTDER